MVEQNYDSKQSVNPNCTLAGTLGTQLLEQEMVDMRYSPATLLVTTSHFFQQILFTRFIYCLMFMIAVNFVVIFQLRYALFLTRIEYSIFGHSV